MYADWSRVLCQDQTEILKINKSEQNPPCQNRTNTIHEYSYNLKQSRIRLSRDLSIRDFVSRDYNWRPFQNRTIHTYVNVVDNWTRIRHRLTNSDELKGSSVDSGHVNYSQAIAFYTCYENDRIREERWVHREHTRCNYVTMARAHRKRLYCGQPALNPWTEHIAPLIIYMTTAL